MDQQKSPGAPSGGLKKPTGGTKKVNWSPHQDVVNAKSLEAHRREMDMVRPPVAQGRSWDWLDRFQVVKPLSVPEDKVAVLRALNVPESFYEAKSGGSNNPHAVLAVSRLIAEVAIWRAVTADLKGRDPNRSSKLDLLIVGASGRQHVGTVPEWVNVVALGPRTATQVGPCAADATRAVEPWVQTADVESYEARVKQWFETTPDGIAIFYNTAYYMSVQVGHAISTAVAQGRAKAYASFMDLPSDRTKVMYYPDARVGQPHMKYEALAYPIGDDGEWCVHVAGNEHPYQHKPASPEWMPLSPSAASIFGGVWHPNGKRAPLHTNGEYYDHPSGPLCLPNSVSFRGDTSDNTVKLVTGLIRTLSMTTTGLHPALRIGAMRATTAPDVAKWIAARLNQRHPLVELQEEFGLLFNSDQLVPTWSPITMGWLVLYALFWCVVGNAIVLPMQLVRVTRIVAVFNVLAALLTIVYTDDSVRQTVAAATVVYHLLLIWAYRAGAPFARRDRFNSLVTVAVWIVIHVLLTMTITRSYVSDEVTIQREVFGVSDQIAFRYGFGRPMRDGCYDINHCMTTCVNYKYTRVCTSYGTRTQPVTYAPYLQEWHDKIGLGNLRYGSDTNKNGLATAVEFILALLIAAIGRFVLAPERQRIVRFVAGLSNPLVYLGIVGTPGIILTTVVAIVHVGFLIWWSINGFVWTKVGDRLVNTLVGWPMWLPLVPLALYCTWLGRKPTVLRRQGTTALIPKFEPALVNGKFQFTTGKLKKTIEISADSREAGLAISRRTGRLKVGGYAVLRAESGIQGYNFPPYFIYGEATGQALIARNLVYAPQEDLAFKAEYIAWTRELVHRAIFDADGNVMTLEQLWQKCSNRAETFTGAKRDMYRFCAQHLVNGLPSFSDLGTGRRILEALQGATMTAFTKLEPSAFKKIGENDMIGDELAGEMTAVWARFIRTSKPRAVCFPRGLASEIYSLVSFYCITKNIISQIWSQNLFPSPSCDLSELAAEFEDRIQQLDEVDFPVGDLEVKMKEVYARAGHNPEAPEHGCTHILGSTFCSKTVMLASARDRGVVLAFCPDVSRVGRWAMIAGDKDAVAVEVLNDKINNLLALCQASYYCTRILRVLKKFLSQYTTASRHQTTSDWERQTVAAGAWSPVSGELEFWEALHYPMDLSGLDNEIDRLEMLLSNTPVELVDDPTFRRLEWLPEVVLSQASFPILWQWLQPGYKPAAPDAGVQLRAMAKEVMKGAMWNNSQMLANVSLVPAFAGANKRGTVKCTVFNIAAARAFKNFKETHADAKVLYFGAGRLTQLEIFRMEAGIDAADVMVVEVAQNSQLMTDAGYNFTLAGTFDNTNAVPFPLFIINDVANSLLPVAALADVAKRQHAAAQPVWVLSKRSPSAAFSKLLIDGVEADDFVNPGERVAGAHWRLVGHPAKTDDLVPLGTETYVQWEGGANVEVVPDARTHFAHRVWAYDILNPELEGLDLDAYPEVRDSVKLWKRVQVVLKAKDRETAMTQYAALNGRADLDDIRVVELDAASCDGSHQGALFETHELITQAMADNYHTIDAVSIRKILWGPLITPDVRAYLVDPTERATVLYSGLPTTTMANGKKFTFIVAKALAELLAMETRDVMTSRKAASLNAGDDGLTAVRTRKRAATFTVEA